MLDDLALIVILVGLVYGAALLTQRRVHRIRRTPARVAVGHRMYASPLISMPGEVALPRARLRGLRGVIDRLLG